MKSENRSNDRSKLRDSKVSWLATVNLDVVDRVKEKAEKYKCVETTSLRNIKLYPLESKEASQGEVSSISTFIKYSKTLASKDLEDEKALNYNNYAELAGLESLTGRRDYEASVGDYKPGIVNVGEYDSSKERDTSQSAEVIILPPFGARDILNIVLISIASLSVLAVGIVIVKKKFVTKK